MTGVFRQRKLFRAGSSCHRKATMVLKITTTSSTSDDNEGCIASHAPRLPVICNPSIGGPTTLMTRLLPPFAR